MASVEVAVDAAHRSAYGIPSVAIVAPGLVRTATSACALLMSGLVGEIVLIGMNRDRVEGHVGDLPDAALYSSPTRIAAGGYDDCARRQPLAPRNNYRGDYGTKHLGQRQAVPHRRRR
jgi:hypothetical protein